MKSRVLVTLAVAATAVAGWSIWVDACDHNQQTSATRASVASASSCAGHQDASVATAGVCAGHGATATTASNDACRGHAWATTASNGACPYHSSATTASNDACRGHASAMTASNGTCGEHGATAGAACKFHDMAMSGASCLTGMSIRTAGAGCSAHGKSSGFKSSDFKTADMMHHGDCDACKDMAACADQLTANGAQLQVVPLKNGVMFVYTTDTAARARAIQTAMARRNEQLVTLAASGNHAKLCPDCKVIRGAMASGKLNRETLNIEGGCLTLMTSTDPAVVAKLHSMSGMGSARTRI